MSVESAKRTYSKIVKAVVNQSTLILISKGNKGIIGRIAAGTHGGQNFFGFAILQHTGDKIPKKICLASVLHTGVKLLRNSF